MQMMFSVLVLIVLFCNSSFELALRNNAGDGELLMVLVFHRHGERNRIHWTYPNDPYKDISFWPRGFSQLTDKGVQEQYDLGVYLRKRYKDFLPSEYYYKDIYVRSSETDRSIVSANVLLAGLYPPTGSEPWFKNIPSQLIPVHSLPRDQDPVLGMRKDCPKFNKLYQLLLNSPEIAEINNQNAEMFANLTKITGMKVKSILEAERVHLTLDAAVNTGKELPEWARGYFPKLKEIAGLCYSLFAYNIGLARLKAGPFFDDVITNMKMRLQRNKDNNYKFVLYSGHESGLGNLLTAIGAFDGEIPPHSSYMIIELRRKGVRNYVTVEYNNTREVRKLDFDGCEVHNCTLEEFEGALAPLVLNLDQWEEECRDIYSGPFIYDRNAYSQRKILQRIKHYTLQDLYARSHVV